MMPILVIFLIWYFAFGRNNPKTYNKLDGKLGPIIFWLVALTIFPSFIPGVLGAMFGLTIAAIAILAAFSPVLVPAIIIANLLGKGNKKKKGKRTTYTPEQRYMSTGLTKSVPKRRKIVKKFNKMYELNLTDEEINKIVDASYMSFAWEKEIKDMDGDYDNIFEWYNSMTNWLRAYLKAFPVHTVSSDFARQKDICVETFDQLLKEVNPSSYSSLEECIYDINNKYYCVLDETTFMMLFRLLQASGRSHKLPTSSLIKHESDIDMLKRKYDQTENADVYSGATASDNASFDLDRMRRMY